MQHVVLAKSRLPEFIAFLASSRKLVAPVSLGYGQYKFAAVTSAEEISLHYIPTILPPKTSFMPQHETLLRYDISKGQQMEAVVEAEDLVIFAVHTCDLAGIQCLNVVFSDRPRDLHYLIRKGKILLIGFECNDYCDGYANCAMLRNHLPKGGYDLFFTELPDVFFVHVATAEGEDLVRRSQLFFEATESAREDLQTLRAIKKKGFKSEVPIRYQDLPRLFEETFESAVWDDVGRRCLACGNCTNVCPSCYCFDVMDETDLDLLHGRRMRVWDSCQNEGFARVAGGENFRKERSERQRHRYNRKFCYPVERYRRIFCTGCGRCSRTCMAKIDLKETINALIEERG